MRIEPEAVAVLQVLPGLETGGAEKMVVHLASELLNSGVSTGVVSFFQSDGSQLRRALEQRDIPVWTLGKRMGPDPALVGRFRNLIRALKPRVIHTHLSSLRYTIVSLAGIADAPTVVHSVHRIAERDSERWLRWLQSRCMARCAEVIAVSREVANSCARVYGRAAMPVIRNGIPLAPPIAPSMRAEIRRAVQIPDDAFAFCCVARLRPVKNHNGLMRAFAELPQDNGAFLLLAGDGELRNELTRLAGQLRIASRVRFLGEREDIGPLLAASDAFVLASFSEGTPVSMLEAMAAGLPIIATAVGGVPEIIGNGGEGLLAKPGSTQSLSDCMRRIMADGKVRSLMSLRSRETVRQHFSAGAMTRSYISIYQRVGVQLALNAV